MLLHLIEMSLIINVLKKSIFQNIDFQQIGWDEVFGQIGICILQTKLATYFCLNSSDSISIIELG